MCQIYFVIKKCSWNISRLSIQILPHHSSPWGLSSSSSWFEITLFNKRSLHCDVHLQYFTSRWMNKKIIWLSFKLVTWLTVFKNKTEEIMTSKNKLLYQGQKFNFPLKTLWNEMTVHEKSMFNSWIFMFPGTHKFLFGCLI